VRIFLHEFVTGGGWYTQNSDLPNQSLGTEGFAMLSALAADFSRLLGVSVDVLRDVRSRAFEFPRCKVHEVRSAADERQAIDALAASADWTIIIAPEIDGLLHARCLAVERVGGRLLSPGSQLVALASDKHATAEHLAGLEVRVPRGVALAAGEELPSDFPYPAVLKPRDGAGSLGIRLIANGTVNRTLSLSPARLEEFCPGTAASVAVLCGPRLVVPLVPCRQLLDVERGFAYLGGSLPLLPDLAHRAVRLAARAVGTLADPRGYLGVDLVLGSDESGTADVVIEINPRLTTSYVGLRALCRENLAECMLEVAQGREVELCWDSGSIQFDSSGVVRRARGSGGL
jgi:hypothetical protein